MKLKKVMLMAALAAAIGSVNMVTALADENETETKYGWEGSGNTWRYYDSNGNLKSGWIKAEDGDGRGNDVWYYIDPSTNLMIYNTTRTIDGVSYTFSDDGSWVVPVQTAPKGHVTGGRYTIIHGLTSASRRSSEQQSLISRQLTSTQAASMRQSEDRP